MTEALRGITARGTIMNLSQQILSDITVFNKYAKFMPELQRRETWEEICDRNMLMHIKKYPQCEDDIRACYPAVWSKKLLPSMRSMQFGGAPIELANNRIYNCAYCAVNALDAFWEAMFLLLGGTGLGYSVQLHHIKKLPIVKGPIERPRKFLIGDSIEGWADAVKVLIKAHFLGKSTPVFDYRDIRDKGAPLITSGGKAPGPDPLRICLNQIRAVLNKAKGRKLKSIEAHDIMCFIADSVLSGGIRRAALIALFSKNDLDMLSCKSGNWFELDPQRGRANNSVVLHRSETTKEEFEKTWKMVELNGSGEPGIFWTNDYEMGTNPCCEISLRDCGFCNLSEINASNIEDQEDFNQRAKEAAFLGTLQAGYTNFHYLRPEWQDNAEEEALIGVGMTGIASNAIADLDLEEAAHHVVEENKRVAKLIGINPAARCTTVKPSGTSSLTVGSSSGVHAWHSEYYIRRMRIGKNEAMYEYLLDKFPMLIEDCIFKPHLEAVASFPQKAPENAVLRTESYLDLLERVKKLNKEWIMAGHVNGVNHHNVSCTISLKDNEWDACGKWMWHNKDFYTGLAVLPHNGGTYPQAPFEDCTKEKYEELLGYLKEVDLKEVKEIADNTDLKDQAACAGGLCEL